MDPATSFSHFQLKYCERCGGLWLRPDASASPYCATCEQFMSELPLRPRAARRKTVEAAAATAMFALLSVDVAQFISGYLA